MSDRSEPRVLISLLTWNQKADTLECLASLQKVRYKNLEIAVVDNGSTDGTAEVVRAKYPNVSLVVNERNLGCAEGMNCEIRYALTREAEFLFILGNDTIVDPSIVDELVVVALSDANVGIVCPKVYYYDRPNTLWFARGARMNWRKGRFEGFIQNVTDDGTYDIQNDLDFYPGSFTFVRKNVLEKGVFFDPDYWIYFDDSDWYLRVKRLGWRFAFAPRAKVWHKPSSSVGMESPAFYYYRVRNRLLFMKKYAPRGDLLRFLPFFCADYLLDVVYRLAREGRWAHVTASGEGLLDFCRGKFGEWQKTLKQ